VNGWERRFVEWLIGRSVASPWRETTLGDLDEEYADEALRRGPSAARRWYRWQTLGLVAGAARRSVRDLTSSVAPFLYVGDRPMRTLFQEIRTATRALAHQPGLVLVVMLTLALGVGVNASTFSMIDALVLRPYALPNADRLTMLTEYAPADEERQQSVSPANYYDWRRQAASFDRLAAFEWWWANLAGGSEPEHVLGFQVTGEFFDAVGVRPALGRLIGPADESWGHDHVVVLSDELWQRRFGARADIIGETIRVEGEPYVVIGVAPPGFDFPMRAALWGAYGASPERAKTRDSRSLTVIGLLKAGTTLHQAQAEMSLIGRTLRERYPVANRQREVQVYTLAYGLMDIGLPSILELVQAGALFVLLIAGLNISNLLLARSTDRQREIALRLALGAGRARVVRQLVLESALMGLASVPAALGCAWLAMQLVKQAMPARLERYVEGWQQLGVDGRLVVATTIFALVAAVLVSLIPAVRATRLDPNISLREGGRSATAGRGRHRLQSLLVVGEMALVLPLLVASALATVGAERFGHGPQGYEAAGVLTLQTALPAVTYADAAAQRQFTDRLLDQVGRVPGVASAGMVSILPATGQNSSRPIEIDGSAAAHGQDLPMLPLRITSARYFETMRIPVLQGRAFTEADREAAEPVAIVSRAMAQQFWLGGASVGQRFRMVQDPKTPGPWLTVVGVVGDTVDDWFSRRNAPMFYVPYRQFPTMHPALVVRSASGDPTALGAAVLQALHQVDRDEPASDVMSMEQLLRDKTAGLVVVGGMMGVLGSLALALAVVGLYSLLAYVVSRRRHEIGIRMALGADRGRVLRLTLRQAGVLMAVGIAIGLGLAMLLAKAMEGALFGVVTLEPRMVVAVVLALVVTTLAASVVPARRATQTDPAVALREI